MAASNKAEILSEAMGSFQTVEVPIGKAKIVLRELSVAERQTLNEAMFEIKDGELVVDAEGYYILRKGVKNIHDYWIAATATPTFTVEELAELPPSLRRKLFEEARKVNGFEPAEKTAKNS
jgi:hypothetical protein